MAGAFLELLHLVAQNFQLGAGVADGYGKLRGRNRSDRQQRECGECQTCSKKANRKILLV